jgi:amino acid permease
MVAANPAMEGRPSEKKRNLFEAPDSAVLGPSSDDEVGEVRPTAGMDDYEKQKAAEGEAHFHRLGWKRLTIVLIVTAVALGSLSLPGAFASLGMVAGVILTVGIGIVAMYTSYVIGQVKLKYPHISHYTDVGRMMFGNVGYVVISIMFVLQLVFTTGSHVLTGAIMFGNLSDNGACTVVFTVVSAILLFLVAIPPSFSEMAVLGYIDFVSIIAAIFITIVATGIRAGEQAGGVSAVEWLVWPKADLTLAEAVIAISNIVFAYSFALCQFSFMDEMHTPADYDKAVVALGVFEIFLYTLTGALVYAFVGSDVKSPALLSAGPVVSKVAFGIAIPVIFISGSINTTVVARFLHGRMFKNSIIRYVNTPMGWATWIGLDAAITLLSWIVASAIPFFSDLLAICSSLFISGFTFYFPAIMWFMFIKEGSWWKGRNLLFSAANGLAFAVGVIVLGVGTYASIWDIVSSPRLVLSLVQNKQTLTSASRSIGTTGEWFRIRSAVRPSHETALAFSFSGQEFGKDLMDSGPGGSFRQWATGRCMVGL